MEGLVKLLRHFLENVLHDTQKSINYQPKSFSEAPCFGIQALPMNSMRAKCRATGTWKGCAGCSSFRGSGYSGLGSFGCCMLWALWAWTCSLRFVEPSCLHCRLQGRTERQERRDDMGYGSLVLRIHPTVTASQRLPQTLSNRHPRQLKPIRPKRKLNKKKSMQTGDFPRSVSKTPKLNSVLSRKPTRLSRT